MMHKHKLLEVDLRLFDGAAGAGDGGNAGAGAAQGAEGAAKAEMNGRPGGSRRARSGETILYGKQPDAAVTTQTSSDAGSKGEAAAGKNGASATSDTLEARRRAFEERISGEDKDLFDETFQKAWNRRYDKEIRASRDALNQQKPILDMLMERYNIADGDVGKLQNAIENDNRYWDEAAEEAGLTVEQFKAMKKLERENAELTRMRNMQRADQQAQAQIAKWVQEGDELKKLYPSFDLRAECADQNFIGLLKNGLPVKKAYELMHMEEIKANAAKAAAQTAGAQMAAKLQSKAARPKENGMSTQSAVIVKSDVHNLSRKDRANVARDVLMGKKVRF